MSLISLLLTSVLVAFPRQGQVLPSVERCYVSGSAKPGTMAIWVQGHSVPVHPLGGWVTMVDLIEGTNTIMVADTNVTVIVSKAQKKNGIAVTHTNVVSKVYQKLPYSKDEPEPHPSAITDKPENVTIVLDAGHGGDDLGAISPHRIGEKDANLRMVKAVRTELRKRGFKVVLTRDDDVFVPLYERPRYAHENNASAFVSIHHNAPPFDKDPKDFRYTAVYAWNEIGSNLATAINQRMANALSDYGVKNNGVPHANYAVTRSPQIPSCLIEVDFITAPEGEIDCWNVERRRKVAAAIADGILDWAFPQSK